MVNGIRSMPVLPSRNVRAAVEFWCDRLGFTLGNAWEDDGKMAFAIVCLDTITVALQEDTAFSPSHGWAAYLYIDDAHAYSEYLLARGVKLDHDLHDTFYGMREFDLRCPDGHSIAFGQDIEMRGKAPGL